MIAPRDVRSKTMIADTFTKALGRPQFELLRRELVSTIPEFVSSVEEVSDDEMKKGLAVSLINCCRTNSLRESVENRQRDPCLKENSKNNPENYPRICGTYKIDVVADPSKILQDLDAFWRRTHPTCHAV